MGLVFRPVVQNLFFHVALKKKMGVTNELLIRVNAEMEGVDLQICSAKTNLAKAYFKGNSSLFSHSHISNFRIFSSFFPSTLLALPAAYFLAYKTHFAMYLIARCQLLAKDPY